MGRKKLEDVPLRTTKVDAVSSRSGHIVMVDSSWIATDDCADPRVDKEIVRGGSEAVSTSAQRVELPPPPPTYPRDDEAWTVAGSKRTRKRARKKKEKKGEVPGVKAGTTADLGDVPLPLIGVGNARRNAISGVASRAVRVLYATAANGVPESERV